MDMEILYWASQSLLCRMRWMSLNAIWPNTIGGTVHNGTRGEAPKKITHYDQKRCLTAARMTRVNLAVCCRLCLACKCSINLVVHYATWTNRLHMQLWYSSLKKQCFDKRRPQMLAAAEFALCGEVSGLGRAYRYNGGSLCLAQTLYAVKMFIFHTFVSVYIFWGGVLVLRSH